METIDWNVLLPEFVRTLPNCLLVFLIVAFALAFRRHLSELVSRLTRFGAFGVEVEFGQQAKEQLRQAIHSYTPGDGIVDDAKLQAILKRAERLQDLLNGVRILWVDDYPFANANIHRFLNGFGVVIDNARDTKDALAAIEWASSAYEVVISDMNRDGNGRAGLDLIDGIRNLKSTKPVILFVANLNPDLGVPAGARTITDDVGELIHHIFDVIEQTRLHTEKAK